MDDLISRQAFKEECLKAGFFPAQIAAVLKRIPAVDAVEVVRCGECVHMTRHPENGARFCQVWEKYNGMGDEGFCNYGYEERKKNV